MSFTPSLILLTLILNVNGTCDYTDCSACLISPTCIFVEFFDSTFLCVSKLKSIDKPIVQLLDESKDCLRYLEISTSTHALAEPTQAESTPHEIVDLFSTEATEAQQLMIIAIVIGVLLGLLLISTGIYFLYKKRCASQIPYTRTQ